MYHKYMHSYLRFNFKAVHERMVPSPSFWKGIIKRSNNSIMSIVEPFPRREKGQ